MKRVLFIVLALIVIFALAGCNVAPNVPGVSPGYPVTTTPYVGTSPGAYGNYAGRGMYGNNTVSPYGNNAVGPYGNNVGGRTGRNYGNNVGGLFGNRNRQVIGNNRNGGNIGANGAYVFGGNAYGLR